MYRLGSGSVSPPQRPEAALDPPEGPLGKGRSAGAGEVLGPAGALGDLPEEGEVVVAQVKRAERSFMNRPRAKSFAVCDSTSLALLGSFIVRAAARPAGGRPSCVRLRRPRLGRLDGTPAPARATILSYAGYCTVARRSSSTASPARHEPGQGRGHRRGRGEQCRLAQLGRTSGGRPVHARRRSDVAAGRSPRPAPAARGSVIRWFPPLRAATWYGKVLGPCRAGDAAGEGE
jgi:hypothetical protein